MADGKETLDGDSGMTMLGRRRPSGRLERRSTGGRPVVVAAEAGRGGRGAGEGGTRWSGLLVVVVIGSGAVWMGA